jgi:hypothetical protein
VIHVASGPPVIRIATSGLFYAGATLKTGAGTLGCVHSFKGGLLGRELDVRLRVMGSRSTKARRRR